MTLEQLLEAVRREHERQASLGYDREHDDHHASREFSALLVKQAADVAMAAAFDYSGPDREDNPTSRYEGAIVQLLAVGFASLRVRLDAGGAA